MSKAKAQRVSCPICKKVEVTRNPVFFRHCNRRWKVANHLHNEASGPIHTPEVKVDTTEQEEREKATLSFVW